MALTTFTVTNAITASDLGPFAVSSTTGFPAVNVYASRQMMRVAGEDMLIDYVPASGSVKVLLRGYNNSVAVPHEALSTGMTSSDPQDFPPPPSGAVAQRSPWVDDEITLGVDTTFTATGTPATATTQPYPTKNTTYILNKATALAVTLIATGATTPAPSAASSGVKMTFVSAVAVANTVTYGPGFLGDTTSTDVATSAQKVGATFVCQITPLGLIATINAQPSTASNWALG